jgi:hypothetical protein
LFFNIIMSDDAPSTEVDDTPSFSVKGKWAPNASTAVSEESSEPASKSFSVAGRWNPSAGKASDALAPKPAVERSAAVAALSSSKTTAAAKVESPAEAYAAALSKIVVAINGAEYPLSELQAAKKGKEGPLSDIDFELKHVRASLPHRCD